MEKKLNLVLGTLLKAQNYVNGEMEAICDIDAMDSAKELFEELDEAIVNIKSLISANESTSLPDSYRRTWVGYQVKTKDDEFVAPYSDKDVFRTREDVENIIRSGRKIAFLSPETGDNLVIVSRWLENDDEEKRNFKFHGFKNRSFELDEKVWDDGQGVWANVNLETFVCRDNDEVSLRLGHKLYTSTADSIYQLAENRTCPRCGNPLCVEHRDNIDYPYYCPECEENFYDIETE